MQQNAYAEELAGRGCPPLQAAVLAEGAQAAGVSLSDITSLVEKYGGQESFWSLLGTILDLLTRGKPAPPSGHGAGKTRVTLEVAAEATSARVVSVEGE